MNANELIEELEDTGSFFEDALYLKSAALLRQQQAEIEALKNRELTDEEIDNIENKVYLTTIAKGKPLGAYSKELIKAILIKAQEK